MAYNQIFRSYTLLALTIAGFPFFAVLSVMAGMAESSLLSIFYRALVLLISILIISNELYRFEKRSPRSFVYTLTLIFLFLYSMRLIWDTLVEPVSMLTPTSLYYLIFFFGVLLPGIALGVPQQAFQIDRAFKYVYTLLSISILMNILFGASVYIEQGIQEKLGRFGTEKLNPISMGHMCVSLILLIIYKFFYQKNVKVLLSLALLIISLLGVLLANSKGPILSLVLVILLMVFIKFKSRFYWLTLIMLTLSLVAYVALYYVKQFFQVDVLGRISSVTNSNETSTTSRLESYANAWQQYSENPILGSALVELNGMGYPHNVIIESFMATGTFGGLLFVSIIMISIYMAIQLMAKYSNYGWVSCLYFQYLIGAQTSGALWNVTSFWAMTFYLFAVCMMCKQYRSGKVVLCK